MSSVATAVMSRDSQKDSAKTAGKYQYKSAQLGIDESRRQFNKIQELLKPYVESGNSALSGMLDLMGLSGGNQQQLAIEGLANSPQMAAMLQQGENSILQNASATGGLRGGNTQAALAQFRPQLLNQLIQQQYANLSGLAAGGQNAAAGVGNAGMTSSQQIQNLLQSQGAAKAGTALASGKADANLYADLGKVAGVLTGYKF